MVSRRRLEVQAWRWADSVASLSQCHHGFKEGWTLLQVFLTRSHLAIVFEYAAGGNLAHYIETFQSSKTGRGISEVAY